MRGKYIYKEVLARPLLLCRYDAVDDNITQIQDKANGIPQSTITFENDMNPIILPPSMGRLGSLALVRQQVKGKKTLN